MVDVARCRILMLDDEELNIRVLERILRKAGFTQLHSLRDPRRFMAAFESVRPDLVLLDWHMPHFGGWDVLAQLRERAVPGEYLPVLVLSGDMELKARQSALAGGAHDFLLKPFDPTEVVLRIRNLLETRRLHQELSAKNTQLEQMVAERTVELDAARLEVLERLAVAAEYRDDDTGQHTRRVGESAAALARALALPDDLVDAIRRAAPLHDVGKIGVPDQILRKPGRLDEAEMATMRAHTTIGASILAEGRSPMLRLAEEIARAHHERWDGTGYPAGLAGEAIPLAGRIVAVADVFDALAHDRPYRPAWPLADAIAEIRGQRGRQFDPAVVEAFLSLHAEASGVPA
jgi:putative two-component system response regulator